MNHAAVIHAFFDEYCVAWPEQASPAAPDSQTLPHAGGAFADRIIETMTPAYPVAMLVSLCTRELQRHLPADEETTIGTQVHCWRCAPFPAGSRIRMTGWVERLAERDVTFHVTAQDELEQIYEGHIQFLIVRRVEMARLMSRKRNAIARREMFAAA
jgi:fluoroacetyl-CoA thioesterase